MNNSLHLKSSFFHSLAGRTNSYKSKFINSGKPALVWFILVVFLLSSLPVRGAAKLVDERADDKSTKVIEFNSENERKWERDLKEIGNFTTPDTSGLINVRSEKKTNKYVVLQIEYKSVLERQKKFTDSKVSKIKGVTVLTTIDKFADVFVRLGNKSAFSQIYNDPGMVRAEKSAPIPIPSPPPLARAKFLTRGDSEEIVRGGFAGLDGKKATGKNVIIATVDTGIDFTHPDFITYDVQGNPISRLLYLWDPSLEYRAGRGEKGPFLYPNQVPIGTLFSRDHLTAELRAIRTGAAPVIPSTDEKGHGTPCAAIAAGNGNADQGSNGLKRPEVVGVAPDASIIGVRIDRDNTLGNTYLLNAVYEWLDTVAGERPLVISASYGSNLSGHDGQTVNERELNKRLANGEKKRRIMVVAAGNQSQKSIHAYAAFGNRSDSRSVSWKAEVPIAKKSAAGEPEKKELTRIRLYFDSSSEKNIRIEPVDNTVIVKPEWEFNKITRQVQATLEVKPGQGKIRLYNTTGQQTEAHLYFDNVNQGTFIDGVDNRYLVQAPGTADSVITVGGYGFSSNFHRNGNLIELKSSCQDKDKNNLLLEIGKLLCYSGAGPTRDKRSKPDVVAPAEWYTASYARDSTIWKKDLLDSTKKYGPMNGTSAATPYTAGIIALLFEKKPDLTANQVKELFKNCLTKTGLRPFSSKFPDNNWGNGKLDMDAVKKIFEALEKLKAASD